jgi:nicotinamidase-related amidase
MLMDRNQSTLLIIDLQARLQPMIEQGASVVDNCRALIGVADRLGVPCVISEQYPQGLGGTVDEIRAVAGHASFVEKTHFSCVAEGCLGDTAINTRRQVIVGGTEAHVCVQQTVLDLLGAGKIVFVVADAVGSRAASNKSLALERMRDAGAQIVSREMVMFEWLRKAATDEFRQINRDFIR